MVLHSFFQQNSAPSHKAQTIQEWLVKHFQDHITPNFWLSSSPGLNPLDYYMWGVVETDVNKHPHNSKNSLEAFIVGEIYYINEDH